MEKLKDIDLLIKSSQSVEGDESVQSELFTTGSLHKAKNKLVIRYENDSDGMSEIVLWGPRTVMLNSGGDIKYSFRLVEGKTTQSNFEIQGLFACVSVKTTRVNHKVNSTGGTINLEYEMGTETEIISKNKVNISLNCSN